MTVYSTLAPPPHRFSTEKGKQHLTVELPSLESLQGVDLDISTTEIRLLLPGSSEQLRVSLPLELAHLGVPTAKFSRKRRELSVTWDSNGAEPTLNASAIIEGPTPQPMAPEKSAASATSPTQAAPQEKSASGQGASPIEAKDDGIDCMEFLEDEVEDALKQCAVAKLKSIASLKGATVLPSDFVVKGDAFIKNGCCDFKASVSFKWEMLDAIGGFLGAAGTMDIPELSRKQDAPKVIVNIFKGGSAQARAAGEWMKRQGSDLISECLNGANLSRKVFSAWDEADFDTEDQSPADTTPPAPLDPEAVTQWATTWLEQKMSNLTVKLFGGSASATFSAPKVTGDVSISGIGNDAIVDFQLHLGSSWSIATSIGQTDGSLSVAEFTAALGAEGSAVTVEAAPGKKASGQLLTAFRQTGVSAVRGILAQFVAELDKQVKR